MAKHVICDVTNRFIYLQGDILPISATLVENALKRLLENDSHKPIHFYISGAGGDCHASLRIFQMLVGSKAVVYTTAVGFVSSGAFLVLQAGEKRFATEEAALRFHMAKYGKEALAAVMKEKDMNAKTLTDLANDLRLIDARQLLIFTYRGKPISEISRLFGNNAQISAKKAKALNLIDGIVSKNTVPQIPV